MIFSFGTGSLYSCSTSWSNRFCLETGNSVSESESESERDSSAVSYPSSGLSRDLGVENSSFRFVLAGIWSRVIFDCNLRDHLDAGGCISSASLQYFLIESFFSLMHLLRSGTDLFLPMWKPASSSLSGALCRNRVHQQVSARWIARINGVRNIVSTHLNTTQINIMDQKKLHKRLEILLCWEIVSTVRPNCL